MKITKISPLLKPIWKFPLLIPNPFIDLILTQTSFPCDLIYFTFIPITARFIYLL